MKTIRYFFGVIILISMFSIHLNAQSKFELAKQAIKEENFSKAFSLLKESSEIEKNDEALKQLALLYYLGKGVKKDVVKADEILNVLANRGNVSAMLELAGIALDTNDPPKTTETALKWFKKAAEKGEIEAMAALGELYYGVFEGIPANYPESYRFYKMASDKGDELSSATVSNMYFEGLVPNKPTKYEVFHLLRYHFLNLTFRPNTNYWGSLKDINECYLKLVIHGAGADYEVILPTDIQTISEDGSFQYEGNKLVTKNVKVLDSSTSQDVGKETLWKTTDLVKLNPVKTDVKLVFKAMRYLNDLCKKK